MPMQNKKYNNMKNYAWVYPLLVTKQIPKKIPKLSKEKKIVKRGTWKITKTNTTKYIKIAQRSITNNAKPITKKEDIT